MLRRLLTFFVLSGCVVSIPAAAQELPDKPTSKDRQLPQVDSGTPAEEGPNPDAGTTLPTEPPPAAPPPTAEVKPVAAPEGWHTELTGYFRAPISMGISSRQNPDTLDPMTNSLTGPSSTQVSFGPNRTVDASYYSFAYTRLQEQDWAEVFIHEKHKHVDAVVGWMGYWFQSVGYRNYDAAWLPGMAYVALDFDFAHEIGAAPLKPNIALTTGAWWPKFGYFEKYDTYTLGRFRQIGAQLKFTIPLGPNFTLTGVHGFGTGRDGSFNPMVGGAPPIYGGTTSLDLITYHNYRLTYKKYLDVGLHFNTEWTADPNKWNQSTLGDKSYTAAQLAHLTVVGAEANLSAPYAGRLWISPSFLQVRNGWALDNTGTEVMHSLSGAGVATNYFGLTNSVTTNTGSGSMFNLGFLYENTLSGIQGLAPGSRLPEVTLNVFGLLANASLDLPVPPPQTMPFPQKSIKQFKYGADVTVQALSWLALMIRYDLVNYDLDNPARIFSAITPRAVFSSHFLSGERIYIQYSRYIYGDKMVLAGKWPWNTPLVAGSDVLQQGPYAGKKPDEDVVKLQADIAF